MVGCGTTSAPSGGGQTIDCSDADLDLSDEEEVACDDAILDCQKANCRKSTVCPHGRDAQEWSMRAQARLLNMAVRFYNKKDRDGIRMCDPASAAGPTSQSNEISLADCKKKNKNGGNWGHCNCKAMAYAQATKKTIVMKRKCPGETETSEKTFADACADAACDCEQCDDSPVELLASNQTRQDDLLLLLAALERSETSSRLSSKTASWTCW